MQSFSTSLLILFPKAEQCDPIIFHIFLTDQTDLIVEGFEFPSTILSMIFCWLALELGSLQSLLPFDITSAEHLQAANNREILQRRASRYRAQEFSCPSPPESSTTCDNFTTHMRIKADERCLYF